VPAQEAEGGTFRIGRIVCWVVMPFVCVEYDWGLLGSGKRCTGALCDWSQWSPLP
jgi:hypothetical protein